MNRFFVFAAGAAAVIAAQVLAGASTWASNYTAPTLPHSMTIVREPENGYVPVRLNFRADPTADALADGAKPAQWAERGRLSVAAAQACYGAVEVLDDSDRPAVFTQPRTVVDGGP